MRPTSCHCSTPLYVRLFLSWDTLSPEVGAPRAVSGMRVSPTIYNARQWSRTTSLRGQSSLSRRWTCRDYSDAFNGKTATTFLVTSKILIPSRHVRTSTSFPREVISLAILSRLLTGVLTGTFSVFCGKVRYGVMLPSNFVWNHSVFKLLVGVKIPFLFVAIVCQFLTLPTDKSGGFSLH